MHFGLVRVFVYEHACVRVCVCLSVCVCLLKCVCVRKKDWLRARVRLSSP